MIYNCDRTSTDDETTKVAPAKNEEGEPASTAAATATS